MLNKLKALLAKEKEGSVRLTENRPDPQLAICAILLEVARVDNVFDASERTTITMLLRKKYDLSEQEVEELIALTEAEREKHPDLWAFTNTISRAFTPQEKLSLLVMVWQVIFADRVLDAHEDMLVRKLQHMLAVNHSLVIKAKQMAREDHPLSGPFPE
ncbi:MAG: TerB family tellurite resistance protein [SAR324 cluster bacterium]|nr:TerB family tellurite resistance protein [SAR324 cluster bacterium]MCZ6647357.1 TerB family tellurite resistance protein [SAR324 cluster bacterium]